MGITDLNLTNKLYKSIKTDLNESERLHLIKFIMNDLNNENQNQIIMILIRTGFIKIEYFEQRIKELKFQLDTFNKSTAKFDLKLSKSNLTYLQGKIDDEIFDCDHPSSKHNCQNFNQCEFKGLFFQITKIIEERD